MFQNLKKFLVTPCWIQLLIAVLSLQAPCWIQVLIAALSVEFVIGHGVEELSLNLHLGISGSCVSGFLLPPHYVDKFALVSRRFLVDRCCELVFTEDTAHSICQVDGSKTFEEVPCFVVS